MHDIGELDQRIADAKKLLALDQLHLERVRQANLDESSAVDLGVKQARYLDSLIAQRARVVAKRVATNRASAKRQKPTELT